MLMMKFIRLWFSVSVRFPGHLGMGKISVIENCIIKKVYL